MRWLTNRLFFGVLCICALTVAFALYHPRSTLPDAWHPFKPLSVTDDVTPVTPYKLTHALQSGQACLAALETGADFVRMPDLEESDRCHIRTRVELRGVAGIRLIPVQTRCQTALRLALWAEHGVKPAAIDHLGQVPVRLLHNSSYNCRPIRTTSGDGNRMSTHARAESIDISGVEMPDGAVFRLQEGWSADDARQTFFKAIRDSACDWFKVTLGPDYNALHSDHFHLQHTGWGLCR